MGAGGGGAAQEEITSGRWAWFIELFADVGVTVLVTIFGFIVLALVGAALGYLVSSVVWRFVVAHRRKRKLRAMARPAALCQTFSSDTPPTLPHRTASPELP